MAGWKDDGAINLFNIYISKRPQAIALTKNESERNSKTMLFREENQ